MNRYNKRPAVKKVPEQANLSAESPRTRPAREKAKARITVRIVALVLSAVLVLAAGGAVYLFWDEIKGLFAPPKEPVVITTLAETDPEYAANRFVYTPLTYQTKTHGAAQETYAISLVEGIDFCKTPETTLEEAKAEIDAAVSLAGTVSANTVWIPISADGGIIAMGSADYAQELAAYAVSRIREGNFRLGLCWSPMRSGDVKIDPTVAADVEKALANAQTVAGLGADMVTLFDCGYTAGQGSMSAYMAKNLNVGFEVYKRNRISDFLNAMTEVLVSDGQTAVGLGVDPVWQLAEHDAEGISVSAEFEDFSDAYADTLGWVRSRIFSYVAVRNFGSLTDQEQPFEKVYDWWEAAALDAGIRLYTIHAGEKIAGDAAGWKLYDQLPKQVVEIHERDGYGGSVVNSTAKLITYNEIASVLSQSFQGQVDGDDILRTLTITAPKKKKYTTYDKAITLSGSSDPNFSVTINDEVIERTSKGYFSLNYDLKIGTNKFVISHKGTTVTYTVEREVLVIKSFAPTSTTTVYAGSPIIVNCVALTGSKVYAMVDGKKVVMEEQQFDGLEDTNDNNSDYSAFTGTYIVPENSKSRTISGIKIYGDWEGYKMEKECASVKVKEIDTSIRVATVAVEYAEVFRENTVDDKSVPNEYPLPRGTKDYIIGEVTYPYTDSSGSKHVYVYYKLKSGKRVYKSKDGTLTNDVTVQPGGSVSGNEITSADVQVGTKYTEISFAMSSKIPFDVTLSPVNYQNANGSDPSFAIGNFEATRVTLTFHYTTKAAELPDFSSRLFKNVSGWKADGTDYTISFELAKKGGFYGLYTSYEDNILTFSFVNAPSITTASNSFGYRLDGITVMLDAGHGGNSSGAVGANPNYPEKRLNLDVASNIKSMLESIGATVIMTRSGDTTLSLEGRVELINRYKPNIFISVHHNYAKAVSARGTDSFYFMPFSRPLANSIYERLASYYSSTMYPNASKVDYLRGCQYYPFYVTRHWFAPSTLVEYGFVSNSAELQKMISPATQQDFARATVRGIIDYCKAYGNVTQGRPSEDESEEVPAESAVSEESPITEPEESSVEETEE